MAYNEKPAGEDAPRKRSMFEIFNGGLLGESMSPKALFPPVAHPIRSKLLDIPFEDSKIRTAVNTEMMAEGIQEMVAVVRSSLVVSQEMRDHAKAATDAANRSGRHALIIAWVSGAATLASLIVAILALVLSSGR